MIQSSIGRQVKEWKVDVAGVKQFRAMVMLRRSSSDSSAGEYSALKGLMPYPCYVEESRFGDEKRRQRLEELHLWVSNFPFFFSLLEDVSIV